jgi:ABC-2 type transport system ATP-binding protein
MSDAIVIRRVTKTFGPKIAVNNLDLTVPTGSVTGFIGPNGAGKTTTIRMIMSIIFPDSGEISVLGKPSAVESKDRIGYLPEERGVYRKMKVTPFLTYMARLKGVDAGAASLKVARWLERVELGPVGRKKCEELSKGMQQKVQFIAAVIHEPELLILDEVFSGLDPVNRRLMRRLIDEQHDGGKSGRTIVFSTHAMYEAEQLCDRIFMIHQGKKTLDGELSSVLQRYDPRRIAVDIDGDAREFARSAESVPGVGRAELTSTGLELSIRDGTDPARTLAELAALGGIRGIALKKANLEDIFIDLVGGDRSVLETAEDQDPREPAPVGVAR